MKTVIKSLLPQGNNINFNIQDSKNEIQVF